MTRIRIAMALSAVFAGLGGVSLGAAPITYSLPPETARFQPGPGVEFAEKNCSVCHSADYIGTQPPKRGKAFWQAEVTKMIKVYGAPIADEDAGRIVEYLAATY